ncbi:PDZ domain-containing protein [Streptomyces sp. bgisy153]|uniref:PDZ domain-containing protein n=1 Tax=Streptomyces sp. bgisy153 TaxID=3413793 RepID=UPI003D7309A3
MEQTALRPKPMPGQEAGGGGGSGGAGKGGTGGRPGGPARRPHAARRRGRRLLTLLFGLLAGAVLVLAGVGLGTVGATVIGMSKLAELQREAAAQGAAGTHGRAGPGDAPSPSAEPSPAPAAPTLGVEVVDAEKAGAKVVAVHVPGPGYTAGLVRGDVLLWFGGTRVESAADLVRAVRAARPGTAHKVTVRHRSGGYQQLAIVPGIVT